MSNKDKFKALLKQVAVSAAMTAVPGTVQFIAEVGYKAYELWLASPPEERESFRAGAGELSDAERELATAELAPRALRSLDDIEHGWVGWLGSRRVAGRVANSQLTIRG